MVVVTVCLLGALYYLPLFMQLGQGLTALESGMRILPSACVMAVLMPIAGRLYDKVGPRWLTAMGFSICAYGNYLLSDLNADVTHGAIVGWTIVRAIGMGFCTMPVMTTGIASVGAARVNAGSAWTMVVRQTSGAIPLAILSAIATGQQSQLMSDRAAILTPSKLAANGVGLPNADPTSIYGVAGVFKQTQVQVLAASFGDVFLITAGLCVFAALLALTLPGRPKPAGLPETEPGPLEDDGATLEPAAAQPAAQPTTPDPAVPETPVREPATPARVPAAH
jgi:hypothetical protein